MQAMLTDLIMQAMLTDLNLLKCDLKVFCLMLSYVHIFEIYEFCMILRLDNLTSPFQFSVKSLF